MRTAVITFQLLQCYRLPNAQKPYFTTQLLRTTTYLYLYLYVLSFYQNILSTFNLMFKSYEITHE
jgi:hypothetical protein